MSVAIVDVTSEIEIDCPITIVADYAVNPDNATKWYVNIKTVEWKTPKPLQIDSLISFQANFLGRELAYTYRVIEWTHYRKFVMHTSDGPFPMETTYEWEKITESKTRMRLRNRGLPSGFSILAAPFMKMAMRKANQNDLTRLRQILEQS